MFTRLRQVISNFLSLLNYKNRDITFDRVFKENASIILMGEPEYNNLGDHAIARATQLYINSHFPKVDFFSVSEKEILYNLKNVSSAINPQDILLLQGGGNMGDIYPDQVKVRKKVINHFRNKILIMPQTIHFSNENIPLPNYYHDNSEHITIFAREKTSFEILKRKFQGKVFLVPDIVLSWPTEMLMSHSNRKGGLICLRNDKERDRSLIKSEELMRLLSSMDISFKLFSTLTEKPVKSEEREGKLCALFDEFTHSEVVITDRLHAMIIAAVTKTPCIVLPTFNHKVVKSYEWIKDINYIRMIDKNDKTSVSDEIIRNIVEIQHLSRKDKLDLEMQFEPLRQTIQCLEETALKVKL